MVYPVSNQQIPAANTFQPGGAETKKPEENKIPDSTRPSGSETARSSSSETRNFGKVETTRQYDSARSTERTSDNGSVSPSSARGSQLDVVA